MTGDRGIRSSVLDSTFQFELASDSNYIDRMSMFCQPLAEYNIILQHIYLTSSSWSRMYSLILNLLEKITWMLHALVISVYPFKAPLCMGSKTTELELAAWDI